MKGKPSSPFSGGYYGVCTDGCTVGRRHDCHCGNIFPDTAFFPAAGACDFFWEDVQACSAADAYKDIHIGDAGNAADAAVDRGVFFTLLCIWYENFGLLSFYRGDSGVCPELCSLFCGNLQRGYRIHAGGTV